MSGKRRAWFMLELAEARPRGRRTFRLNMPVCKHWVIVGDARRAGRETFVQKLREVSAGEAPCFGPGTSVRLKAVGWKQKHVDLMHVNTPSWLTESCL